MVSSTSIELKSHMGVGSWTGVSFGCKIISCLKFPPGIGIMLNKRLGNLIHRATGKGFLDLQGCITVSDSKIV